MISNMPLSIHNTETVVLIMTPDYRAAASEPRIGSGTHAS
jgi:hypothetical protein